MDNTLKINFEPAQLMVVFAVIFRIFFFNLSTLGGRGGPRGGRGGGRGRGGGGRGGGGGFRR